MDKWIRSKKGKLSTLIFDHRIRSNSEKETYEVKKILKGQENNKILLNNYFMREKIFFNAKAYTLAQILLYIKHA